MTSSTTQGESGYLARSGGREVRRHGRIEHPPLHISGLGEIRDVSEGGICLSLSTPVRKGERYSLILTDELFCYTAEVEAEVVWKQGSLAGFRWLNPHTWSRQSRWLRERLSDWQDTPPQPEPPAVPQTKPHIPDWEELKAALARRPEMEITLLK